MRGAQRPRGPRRLLCVVFVTKIGVRHRIGIDAHAELLKIMGFWIQLGLSRYGRGIRRRLAAMLPGDRRRLELACSLMLTLPGTPVSATATKSTWAMICAGPSANARARQCDGRRNPTGRLYEASDAARPCHFRRSLWLRAHQRVEPAPRSEFVSERDGAAQLEAEIPPHRTTDDRARKMATAIERFRLSHPEILGDRLGNVTTPPRRPPLFGSSNGTSRCR